MSQAGGLRVDREVGDAGADDVDAGEKLGAVVVLVQLVGDGVAE